MKKLEEATLEELKSAAYDTLRFIEAYQSQLRAINERILTLENSQKETSSIKEAKVESKLTPEQQEAVAKIRGEVSK